MSTRNADPILAMEPEYRALVAEVTALKRSSTRTLMLIALSACGALIAIHKARKARCL